MKDEKIIQKLKSLQSVQPDKKVLSAVNKQILLNVSDSPVEGRTLPWSFLGKRLPLPLFLSVSMVIVVISIVLYFSLMSGFLPAVLGSAAVSAKIALAPNRLEKATLAVAYAESQLSAASDATGLDTKNTLALSQSVDLAHAHMSDLKLMGEKGKYSSEQCQELYREYHHYLEKMEQVVESKDQTQSKGQLLEKIKLYDNQAEQKLRKYE